MTDMEYLVKLNGVSYAAFRSLCTAVWFCESYLPKSFTELSIVNSETGETFDTWIYGRWTGKNNIE